MKGEQAVIDGEIVALDAQGEPVVSGAPRCGKSEREHFVRVSVRPRGDICYPDPDFPEAVARGTGTRVRPARTSNSRASY